MSAGKTTPTFKEEALVLRIDFFNIQSTWHSNPTGYCCNTTVSSSSFGTIINPTLGNASLFTPRTLQLTAQYSF